MANPCYHVQRGVEPGPRAIVMREIIRSIQTGSYAAGQPLPSARKLSQELNVHRGTVTRAFSLLEEEGYLKIGENGMRLVAPRIQQPSKFVSDSIAVIAEPPESWPKEHHEPGWMEFIDQGILDQIREAGLHAVSLNPVLLNDSTVSDLMNNRPQGIVAGEWAVYSSKVMSVLNVFQAGGLPVVVYGDSPELISFDRVTSDHESGAYQLTEWLISRGCNRVLMLLLKTNRGLYWAEDRIRGYQRAMREAGLQIPKIVETSQPHLFRTREDYDANVRIMGGYLLEHLCSDSADAILCVSDTYFFPVATACRLAGKVPNKDVMIAGYDNYWHDSPERQLEPAVKPAATVDKLNRTIGKEMVKLLIERASGKLPDEPQRRAVVPKMIATESL